MAALKIGFTRKEWCFDNVWEYECRNEVERSSVGLDRL